MSTRTARPVAGMVEQRDRPTPPEQRTITADVQDVRTEGRTLRGFAALYDVESRDLGGYTERVQRGAFADVLTSDPDVILTLNHSPDRVLARTTSGTLRLRDEERGLAFEADLGDGPTAQDAREMVRRGDLSGASFRFRLAPDGERWDGEQRTLTRVGELFDVSLATVPAYDGPRVELRSQPDRPPRRADGLRVEDRTADPSGRPIEDRVIDAVRAVNPGEARDLTTATAEELTPPEIATYLFDRLRAASVALRAGVRVVSTDRESIQWPKVTTDAAAAWTPEGTEIPESTPGFGELTATPRKLAVRTVVSNELLEDSAPSASDVLNSHLLTIMGVS